MKKFLECIYDIMLISCKDLDENNINDDLINISLPSFVYDVENCSRKYVDEKTDIEYWHRMYKEIKDNYNFIVEFISWNIVKLSNAFKKNDRDYFNSIVEKLYNEQYKNIEN